MEGCGDSDADRLDFLEKVCIAEEGLGSVSLGDFSRAGPIHIHHADQFHLLNLGIFLCMELTKVTNTNHTHLDFFHLAADPPLRMLNKLEEMLDLRDLKDIILRYILHRFLQCQTGAKNDAVGLLQGLQRLL